MENIFKQNENCCLIAFSSFLSLFFLKPSIINLPPFLKSKAFWRATFLRHSQAPDRKQPVKCTNYETKLDKVWNTNILRKESSYSPYKDKDYYYCSKNRYLENRIFSQHPFSRTFQLHLSGLKSFFQWFLCVNSRKGLSFCTCFISFIHDSCMILRYWELWEYIVFMKISVKNFDIQVNLDLL